jgi:hypothetical protein
VEILACCIGPDYPGSGRIIRERCLGALLCAFTTVFLKKIDDG